MSRETSRTIICSHAIGTARASVGAQVLTITGDRISSIEPTSAPSPDRWLAMPALVTGHDHGRGIRTSAIGADAKPLESWLHYLALFPSVDPYLAAALSFANSARGGAGTVMVHYTRASVDRPADGSRRGCARGTRCRHSRRLCRVDEGPQSAGLRRLRNPARRASGGGPRANRTAIYTQAAVAGGLHQTRRRRGCRVGRTWIQRPVWAQRRAMVQ